MPNMPTSPKWDRLSTPSPGAKVDRENGAILGYVVAQKGYFKSEGRGQFDDRSLNKIVELMSANKLGTKSRFTHPGMSSDGLGKFLGRAHNPRVETANGLPAVRADLKLDPTSFNTPNGNLGKYVMDLAESDPEALSSSLVLRSDQEYVLDDKGRPKTDETGNEIPPVWRPTAVHASDIVDTGDAVDGLLSAGVDIDDLPLSSLWWGSELLGRVFPEGTSREAVHTRVTAWLSRYLDGRFGAPEPVKAADIVALERRLRAAELGALGIDEIRPVQR